MCSSVGIDHEGGGKPAELGADANAGQAVTQAASVGSGPAARDMSRWLGDGGMPIITAVGGSFELYGLDGKDGGWVEAAWCPTMLACNPHGIVQAGVHSVLLDAAMNFAVNAALLGRDRTRATLEMKAETMIAVRVGEKLRVRGHVVRMARQVAFAEATVCKESGELSSRSTGTFLLHREA
ncbi:MAG: PaaI family thioesterase [Actinobacteria bacterium]|nr:PaaI family thioesterase [Actinomycetota bacterium]